MVYRGSGFTTASLNGDWTLTGITFNNARSWVNESETYFIWKDTSGYWAMSNDRGDPSNQWLSSTDTIVTCPDDDAWVAEDGTIVCVS